MKTEIDIEKLPKWAQEHIRHITRERDLAVRALNEYCDDSTPSPFEIQDSVCTGEEKGSSFKKRYVQAHSIVVKWRGVELRVSAHDYGNSGNGIGLVWGAGNSRECAFIPSSYQSARLVSKDDMY